MDKIEVTPEELEAEKQAAFVPTKEELRKEIITEYGFDETTDAERIDKATDREFAQRTKTSEAIGAKIKHRTDANELRTKVPAEAVAAVVPPKKDPDLSTTDLYALMQAQVPQEDVAEVTKAARLLGVSVAEALKDPLVKGRLQTLSEHRKSAEAANVAPARPGSKKVSDETIVSEAAKGNIPEKGTEEAERLFWARRPAQKK